MKKIIRYIIDIAIPAITAYLSTSESLIQFLVSHNILSNSLNISLFQTVCLLLNVVFTSGFLCLRIIISEAREESSNRKMTGLFNMLMKFFQSNLGQISGDRNISFNLRIFVPQRSIHRWLLSRLHINNEKWFYIRNTEPFASKDITEHLKFRVDPSPQGLVGKAYESKSIVYDDNLAITNSTSYLLDQNQINRTSDLLWSICVPVFNDKNDVIAVVALDSNTSQLDISSNKNAIRDLTNTLAVMMRDSVPELFKSEVSF